MNIKSYLAKIKKMPYFAFSITFVMKRKMTDIFIYNLKYDLINLFFTFFKNFI